MRASDGNGYTVSKGYGGTPNGNDGALGNGGTGFALNFDKTTGSYGAGGVSYSNGYGGGSGGYNSSTLTVDSGVTYVITVGAGGYKSGGAGKSGFVLIAYGQGIE